MINKLKDFLKANKVNFTSYYHSPVYSAQDLGKYLDHPLRGVARTYLVMVNGDVVIIVIPACCEIDIDKLKQILSKDEISFPSEGIQEKYLPDCEADALLPFGNLYGLKVYIDPLFREDDEFVFFAGSFTNSIKMKFSDFERLAKPELTNCCCDIYDKKQL